MPLQPVVKLTLLGSFVPKGITCLLYAHFNALKPYIYKILIGMFIASLRLRTLQGRFNFFMTDIIFLCDYETEGGVYDA